MSKEIKLIQKRDIILGVLDRWNDQYRGYEPGYVLGSRDERKSVGEIRKDLRALNLKTCSEADVDAAIGTTGWVENECDLCGKNFGITAQLGDEPVPRKGCHQDQGREDQEVIATHTE
jgi:hypothetical protein